MARSINKADLGAPALGSTGGGRLDGVVESIRRRPIASVAAAGVLLLFIAFLARTWLLTGLGEFLTVEDRLERADVIFVLAGEAVLRSSKAVELYRAGLARKIVIPRPEDPPPHALSIVPNVTDLATAVMQRSGVPGSAIVVLTTPGGSTSTIEDTQMFRVYAGRSGVQRAIVVTSQFHTRRARWAMRKALSGTGIEFRMASAEDPRFDESNWWQSEAGMLALVEEYLKWIHNATIW